MANIALHRKNSETTDCADFADGKDKIIHNVSVQSRTIEPAREFILLIFVFIMSYPVYPVKKTNIY